MNVRTHIFSDDLANDIKAAFDHAVQRVYHHYYRKNYTLFGHLFQGRYRSLPIETDAYLL